MHIELARSAPEYVTNLALPESEAPSGIATRGPELALAAPEFTGEKQALVVGAQLTEFTDQVPIDLRTAIRTARFWPTWRPTRSPT